MPSAPDPNSPNLDTRLQATFGMRAPGTPTSAGKPGVQAGDLSFPAPPGAQSAANGRPPEPKTPVPTAATPQAKTPQAKPGGGEQGVAPTTGAPPALGAPTMGANGEPALALSPEGDMAYRAAVIRGRESLGPIPRVFRGSGLPELPYEPGRWNYNPFTGAFDKQ